MPVMRSKVARQVLLENGGIHYVPVVHSLARYLRHGPFPSDSRVANICALSGHRTCASFGVCFELMALVGEEGLGDTRLGLTQCPRSWSQLGTQPWHIISVKTQWVPCYGDLPLLAAPCWGARVFRGCPEAVLVPLASTSRVPVPRFTGLFPIARAPHKAPTISAS